MIKAEVVLDSVSEAGVRLTTMALEYPRMVHAEFMTHRMFSKNASSSRAIPIMKMIEKIEKEPAQPVYWGKNQKGMQANEELGPEEKEKALGLWFAGAQKAIEIAKDLASLGVHKQIANRVLEPYSFITVLVTGTKEAYSNFFTLRRHKDAQPEIKALADKMYLAYKSSKPKKLEAGFWHLPYVTEEDLKSVELLDYYQSTDILCKISTARCARVSYLTHDNKKPDIGQDMDLYAKLVGSVPLHASPAEHVAQSVVSKSYQSGNFNGWLQYRKTLSEEYAIDYFDKE